MFLTKVVGFSNSEQFTYFKNYLRIKCGCGLYLTPFLLLFFFCHMPFSFSSCIMALLLLHSCKISKHWFFFVSFSFFNLISLWVCIFISLVISRCVNIYITLQILFTIAPMTDFTFMKKNHFVTRLCKILPTFPWWEPNGFCWVWIWVRQQWYQPGLLIQMDRYRCMQLTLPKSLL